jgi:hypothetical protein
MEQFNLERALAGEPVCTRDGNEVTQLVKFDIDSSYNVHGVINRNAECFKIDGRYKDDGLSNKDLFMKPIENAIWVNVYKDYNGKLFAGCSYDSEKEAVEAIGGYPKIRTIKIVE